MKAVRLFIDTNAILDLALDRTEFVKDAESLFSLKDQEKIDIYISSLTLSTVAYFADKQKLDSFSVVRKFLNWVNVIDLENIFFKQVLESDFLDFEDGLQYFSAARIIGIQAIITRNEKDFKHSKIPVISPQNFLAQFKL